MVLVGDEEIPAGEEEVEEAEEVWGLVNDLLNSSCKNSASLILLHSGCEGVTIRLAISCAFTCFLAAFSKVDLALGRPL